MNQQDLQCRYACLSNGQELRVLAMFGHNLTIVGRDTYVVSARGLRYPERLQDLNETQHRVFARIASLVDGASQNPDDDFVAILLERGDEGLKMHTLWALRDALDRVGAAH